MRKGGGCRYLSFKSKNFIGLNSFPLKHNKTLLSGPFSLRNTHRFDFSMKEVRSYEGGDVVLWLFYKCLVKEKNKGGDM